MVVLLFKKQTAHHSFFVWLRFFCDNTIRFKKGMIYTKFSNSPTAGSVGSSRPGKRIFSCKRFFFSCRRVKTDISPIFFLYGNMLQCQDLLWEKKTDTEQPCVREVPHTGKKGQTTEQCTISIHLFHLSKCKDSRTFPGDVPQQEASEKTGLLQSPGGHPQ